MAALISNKYLMDTFRHTDTTRDNQFQRTWLLIGL
jgi:hypothetical protein